MITRKCDNCGQQIEWTAEDLKYHLARLDRSEHAACACDDDCAALVRPWRRRRLLAAIAAAEAADAARRRRLLAALAAWDAAQAKTEVR